jgi:exosome complex RNA-binding protein Csl4
MDGSQKLMVLPGQKIGIAEEAAPGSGAYERNSEIFAAVAGYPVIEHGEISVVPKHEVMRIRIGQVIYGIVADSMEMLALIEIEPRVRGRERFSPAPDYGVLRVMNIREGFVPTAKTEMRKGDVVRAKVEGLQNGGIQLSTKGFDLGVVLAYCARCRHTMDITGQMLKCPKCGSSEKRKTSSSYGKDTTLDEIKFI